MSMSIFAAQVFGFNRDALNAKSTKVTGYELLVIKRRRCLATGYLA